MDRRKQRHRPGHCRAARRPVAQQRRRPSTRKAVAVLLEALGNNLRTWFPPIFQSGQARLTLTTTGLAVSGSGCPHPLALERIHPTAAPSMSAGVLIATHGWNDPFPLAVRPDRIQVHSGMRPTRIIHSDHFGVVPQQILMVHIDKSCAQSYPYRVAGTGNSHTCPQPRCRWKAGDEANIQKFHTNKKASRKRARLPLLPRSNPGILAPDHLRQQ